MKDKPVAFVTGASGGIGYATALAFARTGYDLAILDTETEGLERLQVDIRAAGSRALSWHVDLTDLPGSEAAVLQTVQQWGRIDVLVNNAAWREVASMKTIGIESWQRTLQVCLTAPAFLSRWVAEAMARTGGGVIVNVSSIMATRAGGVSPAYVAAKGGLDSLTYELATLYGPSGIRVLAVSPGAVDTKAGTDYADPQGQSLAKELNTWCQDQIPLGRQAMPEEVARLIVAMAGPDAAYVTGTKVVVDGGWLHTHFPRSIRKKMQPDESRPDRG